MSAWPTAAFFYLGFSFTLFLFLFFGLHLTAKIPTEDETLKT
jgi:hypothetical protein